MNKYYLQHKKGYPVLMIEARKRVGYVRFVFKGRASKRLKRSIVQIRMYIHSPKYKIIDRKKANELVSYKALFEPVQTKLFTNTEIF